MGATQAGIGQGAEVVVTDIAGREHRMRADSAVETVGHDFPVVWVRRPLNDGGFDRMPWPAEDVRPV